LQTSDGPWKAAVIEALVVNWSLKAEHEDDPELAIHDLIRIETMMALDPSISKGAHELYAKGYNDGLMAAKLSL
jgi:hypothetical protein